jgi:hypothetical protein
VIASRVVASAATRDRLPVFNERCADQREDEQDDDEAPLKKRKSANGAGKVCPSMFPVLHIP